MYRPALYHTVDANSAANEKVMAYVRNNKPAEFPQQAYQPVEKQAAPADASQWTSVKAQEKFTFSVNAVAESWVKKAVSDFFNSLLQAAQRGYPRYAEAAAFLLVRCFAGAFPCAICFFSLACWALTT